MSNYIKTFSLLVFALLLAHQPAFGQEKFSVPSMTDNQKQQRLFFMTNYVMILGADYAKKQGQSMEDYAKFMGEQAKLTWNKEGGFDAFVRGMLYNWESYRDASKPYLKILKQSDGFIQFTLPIPIKDYFSNGNINDISFEDLMKMYEIVSQTIADHLGATYEQQLVKDGHWVEVTIKKKEK